MKVKMEAQHGPPKHGVTMLKTATESFHTFNELNV